LGAFLGAVAIAGKTPAMTTHPQKITFASSVREVLAAASTVALYCYCLEILRLWRQTPG
jgi:hypothetical protein